MEYSKINKPKLLITEEDYENRKFLTLFLQKYFQIDSCDSSDSFYSLIKSENYDLILMDISIKGRKNGLELTREIKQNPEFAKVPVICFTAHAFHKDRLNALDAGCDVFLTKPMEVHSLLNSLFDQLKKVGKGFLIEDLPPSGYSYS